MPSKSPDNGKTYEATVMLRVTQEFKTRLDEDAARLAEKERTFGRARKVGRATVVYEAMRRGLPLLEQELEQWEGEGATEQASSKASSR